MATPEFLKYLFIASLATVVSFFLLNLFLPLWGHVEFLSWSITVYIILAFLIHFLVSKSLKGNQGKGIIGLVILNVFLKLTFTFGLAAIYVELRQPTDRFFLVPILLTYLIFTVFETWFLNIQARGVK